MFERYDETSRHYDQTRVPVGSEIILGCLARHATPLDELVVLDAGCGTGAYSRAIIGRIGRIEAVDLSDGMLEMARAKLAPEAEAGKIRFHRGSIAELPFEAGTFDAVMINQVAHHLGDTGKTGFPALRRVAREFARVLRPGGVLVFNHCAQAQLRESYWYARLIPRAHAAFCRRFAPLDELRAILEQAGFEIRGSFVPLDAVCQGPAYFDGRGPLSKTWRDGDSIWAQVSEEELARATARIRALDAAGKLEAFVAEHDARRPELGQITFVFAMRA
ncbi:MAG: class I SAM-dependent methyltransferase [Kiloniellaceae bacterium]